MKRFTVYRPAAPETHDANQKNAPDQPQFEGVIFSDGVTCLRWLTACRSVSVWASFEDMNAIHGHPEYGTYFVWHDGPRDSRPSPDRAETGTGSGSEASRARAEGIAEQPEPSSDRAGGP